MGETNVAIGGFLLLVVYTFAIVFLTLRWIYRGLKTNPEKLNKLHDDLMAFKIKTISKMGMAEQRLEAAAKEIEARAKAQAERLREEIRKRREGGSGG